MRVATSSKCQQRLIRKEPCVPAVVLTHCVIGVAEGLAGIHAQGAAERFRPSIGGFATEFRDAFENIFGPSVALKLGRLERVPALPRGDRDQRAHDRRDSDDRPADLDPRAALLSG